MYNILPGVLANRRKNSPHSITCAAANINQVFKNTFRRQTSHLEVRGSIPAKGSSLCDGTVLNRMVTAL